MDRANQAVIEFLVERGDEVHVVAHSVDAPSIDQRMSFHRAPKPFDSVTLGSPVLDAVGRRWARRVMASGGRVVVNGGNCRVADANWIHYVHAVHAPHTSGVLASVRQAVARRMFLRAEHSALRLARIMVANSKKTQKDLIDLGVPPERIRVVYCGVDAERFRPPSQRERAEVRAELNWPPDAPVVAFVGALGDRRKGFDTLFEAWSRLARQPRWDAHLAVLGAGHERRKWEGIARGLGLTSIHFLGFRTDVPRVLGASDLLVAPTRYEPYGLNVVEALSVGLPAMVSACAGVAERFPHDLRELLLEDPNDAAGLATRLCIWRESHAAIAARVQPFASRIRAYTWKDMAEAFVQAVEEVP